MKEGDVILTPMTQSDGKVKNRPAICLRDMPPFQDMLVCGVSTQIHQLTFDFDELITSQDSDFSSSGLVNDSLIRLGFLAVLPRHNIIGSIGSISPERYQRLLRRLSEYLIQEL
jgi:mRNA interferase MazF